MDLLKKNKFELLLRMKNKTIQKSSSYPPPLELNCRLNSRLLILLGKPQKKVTTPMALPLRK